MKMLILTTLAVTVMLGCTATQPIVTRGSPFVPFPPTAIPTRLQVQTRTTPTPTFERAPEPINIFEYNRQQATLRAWEAAGRPTPTPPIFRTTAELLAELDKITQSRFTTIARLVLLREWKEDATVQQRMREDRTFRLEVEIVELRLDILYRESLR